MGASTTGGHTARRPSASGANSAGRAAGTPRFRALTGAACTSSAPASAGAADTTSAASRGPGLLRLLRRGLLVRRRGGAGRGAGLAGGQRQAGAAEGVLGRELDLAAGAALDLAQEVERAVLGEVEGHLPHVGLHVVRALRVDAQRPAHELGLEQAVE